MVVAAWFLNSYWVGRYDGIIRTHAAAHSIDERLVWSIVYQETYFRPWMIGADEEVGLMQITPTVARMWAKDSGDRENERLAAQDVQRLMLDPERNVRAGCWYFELVRERYRGSPAENALALAAYNAGPSRVEEWTRGTDPMKLSEEEFIARIGIDSTRAYVRAILERLRSGR